MSTDVPRIFPNIVEVVEKILGVASFEVKGYLGCCNIF